MKRPDFALDGRVVLVSGGYGGIGLAIAKGCLAAGAAVALGGRNQAKAEQAASGLAESGGRARGLRLDVVEAASCRSAVSTVLDAFGRLDAVFAVAGVNHRVPPQDVAEPVWDEIVDVSLKGTFLLAQAAFEALKSGGDGRIVTIGSMMSILANGVTAPYAAAKGGVVQLTRSLAVAWAEHGIKANCLVPGWIDTPLTAQARADLPQLDRDVRRRTPAGRWGRPDDLAGAAVFLASPASAFITGVALPVDGGFSIRA